MSDEDKTCSICLDGNTDMITECKHHFHTTCLDRWLVIRDICPSCTRRIFRNRDDMQIHDFQEDIHANHIDEIHNDFQEDIHAIREDFANHIDEIRNDFQEDIRDFNNLVNNQIDGFQERIRDVREAVLINYMGINEINQNAIIREIIQSLFILLFICYIISSCLLISLYLNNFTITSSFPFYISDNKDEMLLIKDLFDQISKSRGNFTINIP
jgi:hypothetical protein